MKNFLKSTAIFACIALMFCACSEDTTVDLEIPQVDPSTITSIVSGDGRAILKWDVPDDENITQCYVRFTNDQPSDDELGYVSGSVDEIRYVDVVPGYPATYEFTDLPYANYTVSIHNLGANRLLIDAAGTSQIQEIYTIDKYTKRPTVLRSVTTNVGVTITWSGIPDDCRGVYVSYTDNFDVAQTSDFLDYVCVGAGTPVSYFTDMKPGSTFNFETAFKPDAGLDMVYLAASSTSNSVQEAVAKDPTAVSAAAGYKYEPTNSAGTPTVELEEQYMQVKWTVPANDEIVYSVVTYSLLDDAGNVTSTDYIKFGGSDEEDADSGVYEYGDVSGYGEYDQLKESNVNIRYIKYHSNGEGGINDSKQLTIGRYYVTVHNEKAGGLVSSTVAADTLTLYNPDSFTLPTVLELVNDKGDVTLSWATEPEHYTKATLTYYDTDGDATPTTDRIFYDFTSDLLFADGTMTSLTDIALSVVYQPTGFLDEITLTDEAFAVVPQYAPAAPTTVTAYPGYDSALNKAYVKVSFSLSSTAGADETIANQASIYWIDSAGNTYTKRFESVETGSTTNEVKIYDNLVAGESYSFYVASENKDADTSSISASARTEATYYSEDTSVTAYDSSLYALPIVESVGLTATSGDTGTAYLYWVAGTYADFVNVVVSYNSQTATATTLSSATELPLAESGAEYTYIANFKPAAGLDNVSYSSKELLSSSLYIYETPDAPTSVTTYAGDGKIQVDYTLTTDTKISRVVIVYDDGVEAKTAYITTPNLGTTTSYSIAGLTAGTTYTVSVATIRDEANATVYSSYVDGGTAEVYDLAVFRATCSATPTLSSYSFDSTTFDLTINWSTSDITGEHPAVSRIDFTYANNAFDLTETATTELDITVTTISTLSSVMPGNAYSYNAVYKPSTNALDEVTIGPVSGVFDTQLVTKANMWFLRNENYTSTGTNTAKVINTFPEKEESLFPGDYMTLEGQTNTLGSDVALFYVVSAQWNSYELFDGNTSVDKTGTSGYQFYTTNNALTLTNGGDYIAWAQKYTSNNTDSYYYNSSFKLDYGITIDLSAISGSAVSTDDTQFAYNLSSFTMHILRSTAYGSLSTDDDGNSYIGFDNKAYTGPHPKRFSVYGTNDSDPLNNSELTMVDATTGAPVMDNWELLLDNVSIFQPTVVYGTIDSNTGTVYSLDNCDIDGDGAVTQQDDWDIFENGWTFEIDADTPPVRYIRIIMHEAINSGTQFRIEEIGVNHRGYTTTRVDVNN